jgi:hypothetical protein
MLWMYSFRFLLFFCIKLHQKQQDKPISSKKPVCATIAGKKRLFLFLP